MHRNRAGSHHQNLTTLSWQVSCSSCRSGNPSARRRFARHYGNLLDEHFLKGTSESRKRSSRTARYAQKQTPNILTSEPDLSHQWVTSMQPQWKGLVQVNDGNVRNLQTVLFNLEADKQMRRNALRQLD